MFKPCCNIKLITCEAWTVSHAFAHLFSQFKSQAVCCCGCNMKYSSHFCQFTAKIIVFLQSLVATEP